MKKIRLIKVALTLIFSIVILQVFATVESTHPNTNLNVITYGNVWIEAEGGRPGHYSEKIVRNVILQSDCYLGLKVEGSNSVLLKYTSESDDKFRPDILKVEGHSTKAIDIKYVASWDGDDFIEDREITFILDGKIGNTSYNTVNHIDRTNVMFPYGYEWRDIGMVHSIKLDYPDPQSGRIRFTLLYSL